MLKRLLTAVFVLGLILALNGTAFSGPSDIPGNDVKVRPIQGLTGNHKSVSGFVSPYRVTGASDISDYSSHGPHNLPMSQGVDTTSCGVLGYADFRYDTLGNPIPGYGNAFIFTRNNASNNKECAMRFDGPAVAAHVTEVYGAYVYIYQTLESATLDGVVNVVVKIYNDAGGLPGTVAYSETFALPVFGPAGQNYFYFPFTTPPVLTGTYHIAIGADPAGPATDQITLFSDAAGYVAGGSLQTVTGRGSMYATNPPGPGWTDL